MAALTAQSITPSGVTLSFSSAAAGGDTIAAPSGDERTALYVKNGGGSSVTVTINPVSRRKRRESCAVADRPIIFSGPMVRALLDGRKTMTRRVYKGRVEPQLGLPSEMQEDLKLRGFNLCGDVWAKPRYVPGDRLWVRENFAIVPATAYRMSEGVQQIIDPNDTDVAAIYAAGWERSIPKWRPSIHMPRWASRLTLIVEAVKIESNGFQEGE
jgi:hypothetical protein